MGRLTALQWSNDGQGFYVINISFPAQLETSKSPTAHQAGIPLVSEGRDELDIIGCMKRGLILGGVSPNEEAPRRCQGRIRPIL